VTAREARKDDKSSSSFITPARQHITYIQLKTRTQTCSCRDRHISINTDEKVDSTTWAPSGLCHPWG